MSQPTILVVADGTTRKTIRVALETGGYEVVEAETGEAALRAVAGDSVGLVFVDSRLPDVTGAEFARRIRKAAPSVPLVALTGWAQPDMPAMLAAGFVEVLVKPVVSWHLVEVARHHMGRAPPRAKKPGQKALLIEDDPAQRRLLELALTKAGFETTAAKDGEIAIGLARRTPPDVVLSDVFMPKMDGFQVCRAFRREPALAKIPIVLMSVHYLDAEDHDLGTRFGASRYVSRAEGLDAVIREVIASLEPTPDTPGFEVPCELREGELREEYLQRAVHQLERQATLSSGLARRASLQATSMSILGSISDGLVEQLNPESALDDTLRQCLEATGLSVGAISLFGKGHRLVLRARVGVVDERTWSDHAELLARAVELGGLTIPSELAGPAGDALLGAAGVGGLIAVPITARHEPFGVLVLGSNHADFSDSDGDPVVRAVRSVATQLGQALALGRLFSRLTAAEERYHALFDNARDAISILDADGIILEMNQRWEDILGTSRDAMVGRHIAEFVPEGHALTTIAEYRAAVAKGGGSIPPTPILRHDGGIDQMEFSSTVVEVGGRKLVLAIGRNVTERLKLADQLRHAQRLEVLGQLAGGVAHDMNNVLSVVLTYAQLLEAALGPQDPRREDATEIRAAAERGTGLTRQLLAFSRKQVLKTRTLDLNDIIRGLTRMVQTLLGGTITLDLKLAQTLPLLRMDTSSFEQIIMNLAVNSRDAMQSGGRLTIITEVAGDRVVVCVSDTGSGMDPNTLEHLFEPFFTTKELGKGTGLGLATVLGIVKQYGGDIRVESVLGSGTTFRVSLPIAKEGEEPASTPRLHPSAHVDEGHETVVVVEDEEAPRIAVVGILRDLGYRVITEATSAATLEACYAYGGPIHLLVADVVLPSLGGPELVRLLRHEHPEMRVLFISGYAGAAASRYVPLGGQSFLEKPFLPRALATRVRELLDGPTQVGRPPETSSHSSLPAEGGPVPPLGA